jgi:hypothetical protein
MIAIPVHNTANLRIIILVASAKDHIVKFFAVGTGKAAGYINTMIMDFINKDLFKISILIHNHDIPLNLEICQWTTNRQFIADVQINDRPD